MSTHSTSGSETVVPSIEDEQQEEEGNEEEEQRQDEDEDEVVTLEVHRQGGNEWFMDDFPCAGLAYMELSNEDKNLVHWAITRRSVAVRDITYYIYCRNVAAWAQIESPTAAHEITDVTGINVPVNYAVALQKFYPLPTRMAFPVESLVRSVCIGTYRLMFEVRYMDDGPVVDYRPHKTVILNPRGDKHRRMYMFEALSVPITARSLPAGTPWAVPQLFTAGTVPKNAGHGECQKWSSECAFFMS